jgi:thiamine biosynthesis lipoprotein
MSFLSRRKRRIVFRLAQQISQLSGGAFDVTVGPLVNAWGFGPEEWTGGPDPETLAGLMERVGFDKLILDNRGVRKTRPDLSCDLSAIAKGYGADRAAQALDRLGLENYQVEVGGEICTRGHNRQGDPWSVAIEKPDPLARSIFRIVHLSGEAIATSGDYRNFREVDGVRLSHTIDPQTGRPVAHCLASASVIDRQCARADALATALMVLGPEKGPELARRERLAAFFVLHDGNNRFTSMATPEMEKYISNTLGGS